MALYIVPHDIKKGNAWYHQRSGRLKRIGYGLYVDSSDDSVAMVRAHAVRIAKALFPGACLSHSSAYYRGVAPNGVLYLGGEYRHKTEIEGLTIVQSIVTRGGGGVTHEWEGADPRGEVIYDTTSDEFTLLQMFESNRGDAGKTLAPVDLRALTERIFLKHEKNLEAMRSFLESLASATGYEDEFDRLAGYIRTLGIGEKAAKRNVAEYTVAWNHRPIGALINDGVQWMWTPSEWVMPLSSANDHAMGLPFFIKNLMEEGWLQDVVANGWVGSTFGAMRRYLANVSVVSAGLPISDLPVDSILRPLSESMSDDVFNGSIVGLPAVEDPDFDQELEALWRDARMPVLAGVQKKIPVHLRADNVLVPPVQEGFTHFIKVPAAGWWSAMGAIEWMSMRLARAAGIETATAALIDSGGAPGLLVERFDIRQSADDQRLMFTEDMCAAMGQDPDGKSLGTLEEVGRFVAAVSTDARADMEMLLRMAVVSVVIGNDDLHKKNIALLKIARANLDGWETVRLAPCFDMLGRQVLPKPDGMAHMVDLFALSMNGQRVDISREDLVRLGVSLFAFARPHANKDELEAEADRVISQVLSSVPSEALRIAESLPAPVEKHRESRELCQKLALHSVVEAERLGWSASELKPRRAVGM